MYDSEEDKWYESKHVTFYENLPYKEPFIIDIKSAYLYGNVDKLILCITPEFILPNKSDHVMS